MIKKKGGKSLFNLTSEAQPFYNSNQAIFSLVPQDEQCGWHCFLKGTRNQPPADKELWHLKKGSHRSNELPEFPTISRACKLQNWNIY